jgi:hypothetical protein
MLLLASAISHLGSQDGAYVISQGRAICTFACRLVYSYRKQHKLATISEAAGLCFTWRHSNTDIAIGGL